MKALKISLEHGKIWVAETSAGVRAQSASLTGLLEQLAPAGYPVYDAVQLLDEVFDGIRDSGGSGIARSGQVGG